LPDRSVPNRVLAGREQVVIETFLRRRRSFPIQLYALIVPIPKRVLKKTLLAFFNDGLPGMLWGKLLKLLDLKILRSFGVTSMYRLKAGNWILSPFFVIMVKAPPCSGNLKIK